MFYIAGTGSALPEKVVSNDDLAQFLDTSDEWIFTRTGIRRRHVLTHERLDDLAILSARRALEDARTEGKDVDLILCATMRGDTFTPSLACTVAEAIGSHAPAFDLNAACVGVLYAMEIADSNGQGGNRPHRLRGGDEQAGRLDRPLHLRAVRRRLGRDGRQKRGGQARRSSDVRPRFARHPYAQYRGTEQPV